MGRPTGVIVIAVLEILFGVLAFFGGFVTFGVGSAMVRHEAVFGGPVGGTLAELGAIGGLFQLLIGAFLIIAAVGMLNWKDWGRILSLVLAVLIILRRALSILFSLMHFFLVFAFWNAIVVGICAFVIWYLLQPNVKRAFGTS